MNIVHRCRFTEWQPSAVVCLTIAPSGRRFAILRANGNLELWTQVLQTHPDSVLSVTDQGVQYELSKFLSKFQPLPTAELISKPLQSETQVVQSTPKDATIQLASPNEHLFRYASMFYLSTQWTCTLTIPGTGQNVFSQVFWSSVDRFANPQIDFESTSITDRLFTLGTNGRIVEWDLLTSLPKYSTQSHGGAIKCGTLSPSGTQIALGCEDGTVRVFDIAKVDQEPVHKRTLSKHARAVVSIDWLHFSHIKPNPPNLQQSNQRAGVVSSHAFQRVESSSFWDPPLIASGGQDGVIRVWNMHSGACTLEYKASKLRFNIAKRGRGAKTRNKLHELKASGNTAFKKQAGLRNIQIRGVTLKGNQDAKQYKQTLEYARRVLSNKASTKRIDVEKLEKNITKLNSLKKRDQREDAFSRLENRRKAKQQARGMNAGDSDSSMDEGASDLEEDMFSDDDDEEEDGVDIEGDLEEDEDEDDVLSDDNSEESEAEPSDEEGKVFQSTKSKNAAVQEKKGNKDNLVNISKLSTEHRRLFLHRATGRTTAYNVIRKLKWIDVETLVALDETSHLLIINARTGVMTSSLSLQQPLTVPTDLAVIPATLHTRSLAHQYNSNYETKYNYQAHPDNIIPGHEHELLNSLFNTVVQEPFKVGDRLITPPQYIPVLKSKQVYVPYPLLYVSGVNGRVIELSCTRQVDFSLDTQQQVFNPFAHSCKFVSTGLHTAHTHDILSLCLAPVTTYNSSQLTLLSSGVDSVVNSYAVHPFNINDPHLVKTYFQYLRPLKLSMLSKPPSISTSNYTSPWSHHWILGRHQRDFTPQQIKQLLKNAQDAIDPLDFLHKQTIIKRELLETNYYTHVVAGDLQSREICMCPTCNVSNIPTILNGNVVSRLIHSLHILRSAKATASADELHYCKAKPKKDATDTLSSQSDHVPQYHLNSSELEADKPQSSLISYLPLSNLELPFTHSLFQSPPKPGTSQAFLNTARIHTPRLMKLLRTSPTLQFIQQQPPNCPTFAYPRGFGVDIYTITNHDQLSIRDNLLHDPKTQGAHVKLQLNNILCDLQLYTGTVVFDRNAVMSTLLSMYTMRQFQQDHYLKERITDSMTRRHNFSLDGNHYDSAGSLFDEKGKLILDAPEAGILGSTAVEGASSDSHIHALDLEYSQHNAAPYLFRDNWKLGRWNFVDPAFGLHHYPTMTYQSTTPVCDDGDSSSDDEGQRSKNVIQSIYKNERVMLVPGSNKEIKLPRQEELPHHVLSLRLQLSAVSAISTTLLSPNGRLLLVSDATSIKLFGLQSKPQITRASQHSKSKANSSMSDNYDLPEADDAFTTKNNHVMVPTKIQFPPPVPTLNQYIRSLLGSQNADVSLDDIPDTLYEQCVEEHYYISLFTQFLQENGCQTAAFSPCSSMLAISLTPYAGATGTQFASNTFEKTALNDVSAYPHLGTVILIDLMTYQMIGYIQRNKIVFFTKTLGITLPQPSAMPSLSSISNRLADPNDVDAFNKVPTLSNVMKGYYKQQYLRNHFKLSQKLSLPSWIKSKQAKDKEATPKPQVEKKKEAATAPAPAPAPSVKASLFKKGNAATKAAVQTKGKAMVDESSSSSSSDDSDSDSEWDSDVEDNYYGTLNTRQFTSLKAFMRRHPGLFTQTYLQKNQLDISQRYQEPIFDPELVFSDSPEFPTNQQTVFPSVPLFSHLNVIADSAPSELATSSDLVTSVQFSPCGRFLTTLDKNNTIRLYQLLDKCFTPTMVHLQTLPQNNNHLSLSMPSRHNRGVRESTNFTPSVLSYKLLPTVCDLKQHHLSFHLHANRTSKISDENQLVNNINVRVILYNSLGPNRLERVLRFLAKRVLGLAQRSDQFSKYKRKVEWASTPFHQDAEAQEALLSGNQFAPVVPQSTTAPQAPAEKKAKRGKSKAESSDDSLVALNNDASHVAADSEGSLQLTAKTKLYFANDELAYTTDPNTKKVLRATTDEFIDAYNPLLSGETVAKYATHLRRYVRVDDEGYNPHHLLSELLQLFQLSTYNTPIARIFLNKKATQQQKDIYSKMSLFAPYKKLLNDTSINRLHKVSGRFRSNFLFGLTDFTQDVFPSITGSYDNGHYFVYDTNVRSYLSHNSTRAFDTGVKVFEEGKELPDGSKAQGKMKTIKDISSRLQQGSDPLSRSRLVQDAMSRCDEENDDSDHTTISADPLLLPKQQSYTSQIMPFKEMGSFNDANGTNHPILHHADVSPVFSTSSQVVYRPVVSADTNPFDVKPALFGGLLPSFHVTFSTCEELYSLTLPLHRVYPSVFRDIIESSYYQIMDIITLLDRFNRPLITTTQPAYKDGRKPLPDPSFVSTHHLFHVAHLTNVNHRQRIELLLSECFSLLPSQRLKPLKRYRPILFFDFLLPHQTTQIGSTKSFFYFVNNTLNTYYNFEIIGPPKRGEVLGTAVDREALLKKAQREAKLAEKRKTLVRMGHPVPDDLSLTESDADPSDDETIDGKPVFDIKKRKSTISGQTKYAKSTERGEDLITPHFVGFNIQELTNITHIPASIVIEAPWLQIINNLPPSAYRKKWGKM